MGILQALGIYGQPRQQPSPSPVSNASNSSPSLKHPHPQPAFIIPSPTPVPSISDILPQPSQTTFAQDLDELCKESSVLRDKVHKLKTQQTQIHSEEMACISELSKKKKQITELGQYLGNSTDLDEKREGKLKLLNVKKDLDALTRLFPRSAHFVLRWSLGSANFNLPEAMKIRYKTEYESFKLHCTVYNFIFSIANLYIFNQLWLDLAQYFFLLYVYSSMTLREHILQVNGSRIRGWWFMHHYLSIALTGTVLIWPWSESLFAYRTTFLYYNIYLSAVQYLQYRYQMNRLYTLRALSKIGPMDITTDSAQVHVRNNLTFLLPFLLIAHLLQFYHAYVLWIIWSSPLTKEWQPLFISILYCLLATGNLTVTLYTYFQKVQRTTSYHLLQDNDE